ncbi:MAG: hypothetical protein MSH21_00495, partial [Clostridium sp.]|nr:hypothetical protein [Clostridium sp.]
GIYFGVILMAEKAFILKWLVKIPKVFRRCYSYLIVTISWILFACTKRSETRLTNASVAVFEIMLVTFGMFLSVVYLISSSYNPFLYFRF